MEVVLEGEPHTEVPRQTQRCNHLGGTDPLAARRRCFVCHAATVTRRPSAHGTRCVVNESILRVAVGVNGTGASSAKSKNCEGETAFAPSPQDSKMIGPPEQTWMINFRVYDLDAIVTQLRDAGETVDAARRAR
jgi:hypothetical protein